MNKPRVSVIIPVKNEADRIEHCLKAVLAQSLKPYEVIVVDGHSDDGTAQRVKKFPVKIFYEDYHSRGGARQVGIENSTGEYVAFTDGSCVPDREWLRSLLGEFDSGVIGVGGPTVYLDKAFWAKSVNLAFSTFIGSANSVQGRYFKEKRAVKSIPGGNSIYRKADIISVGGFNTGFISEDSELNNRLTKKGKLLYTPGAVVWRYQNRGLYNFIIQIYRWGMLKTSTGVLGLQLIPPLLVPPVLISLVFTPWVFLSLLGLYLLVILLMGLKIAIKERDFRYLVSIPIVFLIEHSIYTLGFWREAVWPHRKLGKEAFGENGK